MFSSMTCCFQSPLDVGEWGKNRHVNTWIYVEIRVGEKKNVWFYLFIFFMGLDAKKK